jgi:hypothetical protein
VNENVSVKAIEGGVPLSGEIRVVADVSPMKVTESETIVRVDYSDLTMRFEEFL